jgi:hypothetical protein
MPDIQIPTQPVENPILCSPYKVQDQRFTTRARAFRRRYRDAEMRVIGLRRRELAARKCRYWLRKSAAHRTPFALPDRPACSSSRC